MSVPGNFDAARVTGGPVGVPGAGVLTGYLVRPVDGGGSASVLIVHEGFGLTEHMRHLAGRFAALGYTTVVPDLYARVGTPPPNDVEAMRRASADLEDEQVVADLEASAAFVRAEAGGGPLGVIGFCAGGRQALLFACRSGAPASVVDCWGGNVLRANPEERTTPARPVPVVDLVSGLACPALIAGGTEDANPSPGDLAELLRRLGEAGRSAHAALYAGAGHAFLNDTRANFREFAAFTLWQDVTSFFDHTLAVPVTVGA